LESPSPSIRNLARRLLAVEAASPSAADPRVHEAVRVCEKLRASLTRFAGADGFAALRRRGLALARAEVPALHGITEKADGSMEGFEKVLADADNSGVGGGDAAVAMIAHLFALLVTFIGISLAVRLVGETWPNALLDE
jgi:hypothetical protein